MLTNSFGLVMIFVASKFYWWMDPVGAIGELLCLMAYVTSSNCITIIRDECIHYVHMVLHGLS